MRYIEGDLFESDCRAIGHGVNTRGFMGGGVALEVATRFPRVLQTYQTICLLKPSEAILGAVLPASEDDKSPVIFNMFTQDLPGPNASYDAIHSSARETLAIANSLGISEVAIPKIGAGIGGLDWNLVVQSLKLAESFSNSSKFIVYIK